MDTPNDCVSVPVFASQCSLAEKSDKILLACSTIIIRTVSSEFGITA